MSKEFNNYIVTGGSRGLGKEICRELTEKYNKNVINLDVVEPKNEDREDTFIKTDISSEENLENSLSKIKELFDTIDVLVNNAAKNHHNYLEDVSKDEFMGVINTNVKGLFLSSKTFLKELKKTEGTICNIVSNAAKQPMTASIAYNASKGAQLIMTKQLARELTERYDITVFSFSPNKLEGTHMSNQIDKWAPEVRGWSEEYAKEYQLDALLSGEETDPKMAAEVLSFILAEKERHIYISGCNFEYGK